MRAYLYIVRASKDPDRILCSVPREVDEGEIFFGPCKKRLRGLLRAEFLRTTDSSEPDEQIFLVGFNGSNGAKVRKIVWVGRIKRMMTFGRAERDLGGARYDAIRREPDAPLHVRALRDGKLGYEHCGSLHEGEWVADLVSNANAVGLRVQDRRIEVDGDAGRGALTRDLCMLLENLYFAGGCSASGTCQYE